ncbi:hypothetical protein K502DRAFT_357151 [Neoconidiobolus thromboides FSU 785]|nr:hypothetical protein K502DRAFT_357151 [Neoconidiobolus thromboides FSU 785]
MELLYLFNDLLTGISLFCATLVLIFILLIRLYDKDLVNRISLKICAAISIVDIFRTSSFFIYLYHTSDDLVCKLNAIFLNYIIISHMLLTFSIALNLQLVFIHNLRYKSKWQYYYWFLGFLVPFIITFIMVIIDVFGKDEVANACFYKNVYPVTIYSGLTLYAGFLFWNLLGCLYCFTISLFIIYHLKRKTKQLIQLNQQQNSNHSSDSNFSAHQQSKLIVNQSTISLLIRRM